MKLCRRYLLDGTEERFSAFALFVLIVTAAFALVTSVPLWLVMLIYGSLLVVIFAAETFREGGEKSTQPSVGSPRPGPSVPAPSWNWHRQALLRLRDDLLARNREERAEVSQPLEPFSLHPADSATDEFDHDLALARLSHDADALEEIEAALRRIDEGTYGICEDTGKPISTIRLRAIPWTRRCQRAEAAHEHPGYPRGLNLPPVATVRKGTPPSIKEPPFASQEE